MSTVEIEGVKGGIVRMLIGHEYEVRIADCDGSTMAGWFRAKYLTPHAREMGWLWEINDPRFVRLNVEEVCIVEVRSFSNAGDDDTEPIPLGPNDQAHFSEVSDSERRIK